MSLYNKYRPIIWDDVVGQEIPKETLTKAIAAKQIFHAILLVGPKGSGKTTIARIIAQSINCENNINGNPCLDCETCKLIQNKQAMDIHEIDGASNGHVDDIKMLKEIASINSKLNYQVWIIDECHMLSKGAWNAFLKTLEEPNGNTVFILATTDEEKIPETILSRCSTFYFQKISKTDIESKLKEVCIKEGIVFDDEAIVVIAHASKGGMRNALMYLEQASILSERNITKEIALKLTFSVDSKIAIVMLKALLSKSMKTILIITSALEKQNIAPKNIFQEFLDCLYAIYLYKVADNKELLENKKIFTEDVINLANQLDMDKVKNVIEYLSNVSKDLDYNPNPRYFVDVVLNRAIEKYYS